MTDGLLGQKLGMTQVFLDSGRAVPVTVIEAGPCRVSQVKTKERDGYSAVQLAFREQPDRKVSKPVKGHFAKANLPAHRHVREFRATGEVRVGATVTVSLFTKGELVDVVGVSKGKGFQGVVKRHHFAGGPETHGSMFHRAPGSIGSSSFPSRVIKGMRGAGRMGGGRVTIRNLKVLRVDADNHLLLVEGGIPGAPSGYVIVRKAIAPHKVKVAQVEKPKKGKK